MSSYSISPQEAAQEILNRREARQSLIRFTELVPVPGRPLNDTQDDDIDIFQRVQTPLANHHRLWLSALQNVEDGEIKRLMLFAPPGSAKSTYVSVVFPTHLMGRFKGFKTILNSYATPLAAKHGRRARQLVKSAEYRRIFQTALEKEAVEEWSLQNGSEYMAAGILAGVTGNRANGLIIDDPIRGREDADSEAIRKKTKEAYEDDLLTRLLPGGFVVIMATRWHEDDLAGSILPENYDGESGWIKCRDGQDWFVICIPAKAEKQDDPLGRKVGEYLWPEWMSQEHYATFEHNPRTWSALYQQRPSPEDGDYFKREWIRWYDEKPKHLRIYAASDYAVKADGGDYTVHGIAGVDVDDNLYILDIWRQQTSSDVWIETMLDMMHQWNPIKWAEESGQIEKSLGPFINKRQIERKIYGYRAQYVSSTDKPSRARSFQARMAMGKVYFPRNAPWVSDLISEMLTFPAGKHDDQVDVMSLFGRMLAGMASADKPKVAPIPKTVVVGGSSTVTMDDMWRHATKRNTSGRI